MPRLKNVDKIDSNTPVLIAGQTASGKSHLALEIAKKYGGIIINADAIQIYKNWKILTVGSLAKEKGLDTIIKALSNIESENFQLDIFGKEYEIDILPDIMEKAIYKKCIKIIISLMSTSLST